MSLLQEKLVSNNHNNRIVSSGGFGDCLISLNKYKKLLKDYPTLQLIYYTDQDKTKKLVEELYFRNNLTNFSVIVSSNLDQCILDEKNINSLIISTSSNGILTEEELKKNIFYSDNVAIDPLFDIRGIIPKQLPLPDHIILQLDAGMIYHNSRKHWDNIGLAISLCKKLTENYNICCAVIGCPEGIILPDNFINLDLVGFESIEWIKTAKLGIVLSGFVAFALLMSGVPTIMKIESPQIQKRWHGGIPEWEKLIVEIDEIQTDINKIVGTFNQIVKKEEIVVSDHVYNINKRKNNVWIASYDDGNIEEYASLTRQNKLEYAKQNNYNVLFGDTITFNKKSFVPDGYSPEWEQLHFILWALKEHVKEGDWLFYTGADSFFLDYDFKIENLIKNNPEADVILSKDRFAMNNNGMLIHNVKWSRDFYYLSWELRGPANQPRRFEFPIDGYVHQWAEQGAMIKLLDFIGDTKHVAYERQELINGYDPQYYGSLYKEPEFVIHFPDMHPKTVKLERMKQALERVKK